MFPEKKWTFKRKKWTLALCFQQMEKTYRIKQQPIAARCLMRLGLNIYFGGAQSVICWD